MQLPEAQASQGEVDESHDCQRTANDRAHTVPGTSITRTNRDQMHRRTV
jgi:hypothetical protein